MLTARAAELVERLADHACCVDALRARVDEAGADHFEDLALDTVEGFFALTFADLHFALAQDLLDDFFFGGLGAEGLG